MKPVVVITGGANGIGAASARKFVTNNYFCAIIDNDLTAGLALQAELGNEQAWFIDCDVCDLEKLQTAFQKIGERFGKISAFFANAGIFQAKSLTELSLQDWDTVMNTNLRSMVFAAQYVLPWMLKTQSASMVFNSSDLALIAKPNTCGYAMTKAAICALAKSIALDYMQQNIRANVICPGPTETQVANQAAQGWVNQGMFTDVETALTERAKELPLRRLGKPEEVANLVYFLASSEASFITGSVYSIDGGYTLI